MNNLKDFFTFSKNKPKKDGPINKEINPSLRKNMEISKKYDQLSKCIVLSNAIGNYKIDSPLSKYDRWSLTYWTITDVGIDINDIYSYIRKLARERKNLLESELARLNKNN